jgi:hypothetical protein
MNLFKQRTFKQDKTDESHRGALIGFPKFMDSLKIGVCANIVGNGEDAGTDAWKETDPHFISWAFIKEEYRAPTSLACSSPSPIRGPTV